MSEDGIKPANRKSNDRYAADTRFDDAAHAIYNKYQTMGLVKLSDENTNIITSLPPPLEDEREKTVVRSRTCTIL